MSIMIQCSGCKKRLTVKDELAGKRVKCPSCGQILVLPVACQPSLPDAIGAPPCKPQPARSTEPLPARSTESRTAPSVTSQGKRIRWTWYVGGSAVCIVACAVLFFALSGKDRSKESTNPPQRVVSSNETPERPSERAITGKELGGKWIGTFADGVLELDFTDLKIQKGPLAGLRILGVDMQPPGGRSHGGTTTYQVNAAGNEVKIGGGTAVAKLFPDGALLVSGEIHSESEVFRLSEVRFKRKIKGGITVARDKPLARVVVGVESAPVYEYEKERNQVAAYLGAGSRVDVLEVRDPMVRIHVNDLSFSPMDGRKDTLLRPLQREGLFELIARKWWIRRCHLCTAEELAKREANRVVPAATHCLGFKEGVGFFATADLDVKVRNGKFSDGTALWCAASAVGKTYSINNVQLQCKPDMLYYWHGGKVTELHYYAPVSASGAQAKKPEGQGQPSSRKPGPLGGIGPEHPWKDAAVGDWVQYKINAELGAPLSFIMRKTVVQRTDREITLEVSLASAPGSKLQMKPAKPQRQAISLTEPLKPPVMIVMPPEKIEYKLLESGSDKLMIGGKTFAAKWARYEISGTIQGRPIVSSRIIPDKSEGGQRKEQEQPGGVPQGKIWFAAGVPLGGVVKTEFDGLGQKTIMEIQSYGRGKQAQPRLSEKGEKTKLTELLGEWRSTRKLTAITSMQIDLSGKGKGTIVEREKDSDHIVATRTRITIVEKDGKLLLKNDWNAWVWEMNLSADKSTITLKRNREEPITLTKKR